MSKEQGERKSAQACTTPNKGMKWGKKRLWESILHDMLAVGGAAAGTYTIYITECDDRMRRDVYLTMTQSVQAMVAVPAHIV